MKAFYKLAEDERSNIGTYTLTIAIVFTGIILGQLVSEFIANSLGFSLLYLPKSVDRNSVLALLLLPFLFAFIAILLSMKFIHKRQIRTIFTSRDRFDWKRFLLSASVWLALMLLLFGIGIFTGGEISFQFNLWKFIRLLLITLMLLPFQAAVEDLFFRSFIFQGLGRLNLAPIISVIITGVLFGLSHAGNPEVDILGNQVLLYYIMTGVFLGLLTHYDNGMELGMGYHFVNNLFGVLILTNNWQALQTNALFIDKSDPAFGWDSIAVIAFIQPLLFFMYSRIYKWKKTS